MVIIMIIAFKGTGRAQLCANEMCNTYSTCHIQHVVCHVVGRDSSAIKFDGVEIAFILALFY